MVGGADGNDFSMTRVPGQTAFDGTAASFVPPFRHSQIPYLRGSVSLCHVATQTDGNRLYGHPPDVAIR